MNESIIYLSYSNTMPPIANVGVALLAKLNVITVQRMKF